MYGYRKVYWLILIAFWSFSTGFVGPNFVPTAIADSADATEVKMFSKPQGVSSYCPAFTASDLYRKPIKSTTVDPSNWIQSIRNAVDGEEILLADGIYPLEEYTVVFEKPITIRSKSGNRESVVIQGKGYSENAEALMVMGNDVHIADLTVRDVRDHGVSLQEGFARTIVYNVDLIDIGTQHIKGNHMGPQGVIACSKMGYTRATSQGDYNSAIDLHGAVEWTIRDNNIYNIYGDGSGCVVDADCGTAHPGGEPAILLWNGSRDNIIERNRITESFRGIQLGLGTPYTGGVVRNNIVYRSVTGKEGVDGFIEGDMGISLLSASDVLVESNTVLIAGEYPGPVEVQDGNGIIISNNLISKPVWNRGNAEYNGCLSSDGEACVDSNLLVANNAETIHSDEVIDTPTSEDVPAETQIKAQSSDIEVPLFDRNSSADLSRTLAPNELLKEMNIILTQFREERILATEERLKMTEERLLYIEAKLADRESRLENRKRKLQEALDEFSR